VSSEPTQIQSESKRSNVPVKIQNRLSFYRVRHRIYVGLLVFVVLAGLPVIGVPFLRHRVSERVQLLRTAISGDYTKLVTLKPGENSQPFPSEYEQPVAKANIPEIPAYILDPNQPVTAGKIYLAPKKERKIEPASQVPFESRRILRPVPPSQAQPEQTVQDQNQETNPSEEARESAEPNYKQGRLEQEVYDVLLKSDNNLVGLIQGANNSLRFKSWDVAKRAEDLYWVRILFTQLPAGTDMECIWQVQLMAKQVMPLNYNARALPR
jgi:hypothetical protein